MFYYRMVKNIFLLIIYNMALKNTALVGAVAKTINSGIEQSCEYSANGHVVDLWSSC